jgi:hypothetical protein
MTDILDPQPIQQKVSRSRILTASAWKDYDYDDSFKPWDGNDPLGVHTTVEMLEALDRYKHIDLDAQVWGVREGRWVKQSISKQMFRESYVSSKLDKIKFRETDFFGTDSEPSFSTGNDFTPLLGGPFYKQLYFYSDYIRMHSEAFFAYHHDPFARAITQITSDFVLGTGFDMQCDTNDRIGKLAMAAWKSFEEANDFQEQTDQFCQEISIYGESMFYELPNNETKITYGLSPGDTPPRGVIPRVRLIDPSNIVEIVGYPEDIQRPLLYVWLAPTQYQIYSSGLSNDRADSSSMQPSLKFIYRQIPATQMHHYKINSVSNEKRGRSDYFPVLSYLKRLRDAVNYSLIGLQKASAYSIDTQIDGDQTDIDAYVSAQAELGTIPPAGSEFVHDSKVKRQYLGNTATGGGTSDAFQWALSCVSAGTGIPTNWFGTHIGGSSTRASALVATEPVTKKMEKRRQVIERMLRKMWRLVMKRAGLPEIPCDVIFPELITQDRSQKLKDLLLCEQAKWFKPERVASIAASELGIDDYNYDEEMEDIATQIPEIPTAMMPLTAPPQDPGVSGSSSDEDPGVAALTSTDKQGIKKNDRTL